MKTIVNIKTDRKIKQNAQKLAGELGLSLSAVVNAYLKQFVRNKEVHFAVAPHMTPELEDLLQAVERDIKHKRNLSPAFSSLKTMDAYLDSL